MNMKQFRYVLVLAAEGSFSRAAEALGISQPSLSQYLKKIENEVGAQLFDRGGGELRLTDAGEAYLDAGRKILAIERQMENRITDINAGKAGNLVIGISPHRAACLMPEAVKRFQSAYPGIHIAFEERTGHTLLEEAARGVFDLCIATAPVDEKIFQSEVIMKEEIVLAVPCGQVWKGEKMSGRKYPAVDISVLEGASMITLSGTQIMQRTLEKISGEYQISYRSPVSVNSIEAQLSMVSAGLGMALVPAGIDRSREQGVSYYSIRQELPFREIAVVFRKGQYCSKAMTAFIEVLKEIENDPGDAS